MDPRAVLPLLTALVLGGCTGGASPAGGGPDPKPAYVARVSALCDKVKADADALPRPATAEAVAPFADALVAIAGRTSDALATIEPPPADRDELRAKVIDPFAALVADGRAYAAKVRAAGSDSTRLLQLLGERPGTGALDVAFLRSYGLSSCANALNLSS